MTLSAAAAPRTATSSAALVEVAAAVAEQVRPIGRACDQEDAFPAAALDVVRASGLMGLMVPVEHGGLGGDTADLARCARTIAAGDLSTAMIWSMHCQQVAVLVHHAAPALRDRLLPRIAAGEVYIASATTEPGKGGHLLSAESPLLANGSSVRVARTSPVVTGGSHADGFLMTLRRTDDGPASDVVLAYADRAQLTIDVLSRWEMLGMRATQSAGMQLDGTLPWDQVVDPSCGFGLLAAGTMIPVGHIAWASSWLGAADEALRSYLRLLRTPGKGPKASSLGEVALDRLARVRLRLDQADAYLEVAVRHYEALLAAHGPGAPAFGAPGFSIEINNLKVIVSEEAFRAVDDLMTLAGLGLGYARSASLGLERAFRDLRSAALMYANDRLLAANGRLCLVDRDLRRVGPTLDGLDGRDGIDAGGAGER